jgi:LPS sulfotransferase NodH
MFQPIRKHSGFIREWFLYSTSILRRKRKPTKKFLIITTGRTGSELLVNLLNSHPSIQCNSELLLKKVSFPKSYVEMMESLSKNEVYGFKLNTYNFGVQSIDQPKLFVDELIQMEYKIISLKRRNLLRQAISRLYAIHRRKYHHKKNQGIQTLPKIIIEPDQLIKELEFFMFHRSLEEDIIEDHSYLQLFYEDHLEAESSHQVAVDEVTKHLAIQTSTVHSNFMKTTPKDLSEIIENYHELEEFIRQTEYAIYLDREYKSTNNAHNSSGVSKLDY